MYIIYLHGFLSGSQALKATQLKNFLVGREGFTFRAPDFPDTPAEAETALLEFFTELKAQADRQGDRLGVFGSSMGGFFATLFAQRFDFKAVLINPCVHPQDYFKALTGEQYNPYNDHHFELKPQMLDDLKRMDSEIALEPWRYAVFLQQGDEVLDYKRAQAFYQGAQIEVQEGGCHAFDNFPRIIERALAFLAA